MSTPAKVKSTQAERLRAGAAAFNALREAYPLGTVISFKWRRNQVINSRGRVTGYSSDAVKVQMFETKKKTRKWVMWVAIAGVVK